MNHIMKEYYHVLEMYQVLRSQLMEMLADEDLSFQPGGDNPPLGKLCCEIGEVEQSYIDSFKTFKHNFDYRNETPGLAGSVSQLTAWYADLDQGLRTVIEAMSDDDIQNKLVNRGPEFNLPVQIQLEVYKEALLIFYGKVTVYLKAMGKPAPQQWQEWLG